MDYKEKVIALLNSQELSKEQKEKLENIFPELKESEGERIRKAIIRILKGETGYTSKEDTDKYVAWLEKQAEKKPNSQMEKCGKCQFNFTGYCDGTCILENNDQKPVDKIEPKFKPGDWISNGRYVKKIVGINSDYPYYMFQDGSSYHIKDIDTKWYIMPNMDELEWIDMETNENHCYSCELFDRKNEMCKCSTLCKNYRNTYKGFYIR